MSKFGEGVARRATRVNAGGGERGRGVVGSVGGEHRPLTEIEDV